MLATGFHNLGNLNRKLSEVLCHSNTKKKSDEVANKVVFVLFPTSCDFCCLLIIFAKFEPRSGLTERGA